MRRTPLPAVVAAATIALVLAACAPVASGPTSSATPRRSATAHPTATPTASATPLPADVLFRITTVATAPDGTVATLTETVNAPVAQTDHQSGDATQLDNECDGWRQAFTGTQFLVAQVTSAIPAGASWTDDDGQITVDMGAYPVWSGDQKPYQEVCATAIALVPGSARAVSPVAGGKPDATGGWAVFRYGFGVPDASGSASTASSGIVFSRCSLQLGNAAKSSVFASAWASHPDTEGGSACRFGGTT